MKLVFIVGASRSGTTWLQLLLSQSGQIATSQETHLFSGYLKSLGESWAFHSNDVRSIGLQSLYGKDEFLDLKRLVANHVFSKILAQKPSADIVLEKTPDHVHHWQEILELYPEAHFIHLVRDPRAVVASMRATGAEWKNPWANAGLVNLSRQWIAAVTAGRQLVLTTNRAREIRYEDIAAGGAPWLHDLWTWLGVTESIEVAETAFSELSFEALSGGTGRQTYQPWDTSQEPRGMWRKGGADSWREELAVKEIATVEAICKDKMHDFGYPLTGNGRAPARYRAYSAAESGALQIERGARSIFRNIRNRL
jgi:hypothetical protein